VRGTMLLSLEPTRRKGTIQAVGCGVEVAGVGCHHKKKKKKSPTERVCVQRGAQKRDRREREEEVSIYCTQQGGGPPWGTETEDMHAW